MAQDEGLHTMSIEGGRRVALRQMKMDDDVLTHLQKSFEVSRAGEAGEAQAGEGQGERNNDRQGPPRFSTAAAPFTGRVRACESRACM